MKNATTSDKIKKIKERWCCMNKLYNTQDDFTSTFTKFLLNVIPDMRKTQLNILPYIILGMIIAESCVPIDIAKVLKSSFSHIQVDSVVKRIRRFFSNPLFHPYSFYQKLILYIIKNFKVKHEDKTVYITFDHMFSKSNFTVFMFTMRVGTFGVPIWFKCFKGAKNNNALKSDTIKDGIINVSKLFKGTDFKLAFLADRWFGISEVLKVIASLGHVYYIRIKRDNLVIYNGDKIPVKKLKHRKYHSTIYTDVKLFKDEIETNIIYSSTCNTKDPWIIATNGNVRKALKSYSYRFASIEFMFKAQKSNGFNLEKISNCSLKYFENMYACVCVCVLYLTTLGTDFSKNSSCYKNVKIETHKTYIIGEKRIKKRVMSLFNVGLTLFKRSFNSPIYIRIPVSFKLYDI